MHASRVNFDELRSKLAIGSPAVEPIGLHGLNAVGRQAICDVLDKAHELHGRCILPGIGHRASNQCPCRTSEPLHGLLYCKAQEADAAREGGHGRASGESKGHRPREQLSRGLEP